MNGLSPAASFLLILSVAAGSLGCRLPAQNDVAPAARLSATDQKAREEILRAFEEFRESSQLTAALAQWEEDDLAGAERTLLGVLKRNPDHVEARRMLAELYLDTQRPALAVEVLAEAGKVQPADPALAELYNLAVEAAAGSAPPSPADEALSASDGT